ncbi:hypothetical protein IIY68_01525 [Candidatus Saccharibacteria bacterium]|nr:hypothetical protein [Candidatus Saccharibacteria bacterium]
MNSNNEFSVTPMNRMIELVPGETYVFSITVSNPVNSAENFDYKAYAAPYSVVTEEYDADVMTKTDHTRMADWITIAKPTGTLAPNETKDIEFTITVPENAPGGGQYAAIIVGADDKDEVNGNTAVTNVLEIASILYAKVDGEIIHKGEVLENNVPGFVVEPRINISSLIVNEGNMHEIAEITIKVTNIFTGETIASAELDNGAYAELIMPDSKRFLNKEVDELPMIGIINVQQNIYYNGETSTVEKNVIVCPIWFLVLVVLTLTAIIWKIVKTICKHQKKKVAQ